MKKTLIVQEAFIRAMDNKPWYHVGFFVVATPAQIDRLAKDVRNLAEGKPSRFFTTITEIFKGA